MVWWFDGLLRDFVASCEILVWFFVFLSHAKARRREGAKEKRGFGRECVSFFVCFVTFRG